MKVERQFDVAKQLHEARRQREELVGPREAYKTHADYMAALRLAIALKRVGDHSDALANQGATLADKLEAAAHRLASAGFTLTEQQRKLLSHILSGAQLVLPAGRKR